MPIKVTCQCGQSFAAKDEMAGKAVRCPKCKQPLKIPGGPSQRPAGPAQGGAGGRGQAPAAGGAPAAAAAAGGDLGDLFDELGLEAPAPTETGHPCPSCGRPMKQGAVLCVNCGFNLQTGQRVASEAPPPPPEEAAHGASAAEAMIARATKEIEGTPISSDAQDFGEGTNPLAWVLLLCLPLLLGLSVFAVSMWGNYIRSYMDFISAGAGKSNWTLVTLALLSLALTIVTMVAWFRIVFIALDEKIVFGVLCILLCGLGVPIYGIIRWQKCLTWTIMFIVCIVLSIPLYIVQFFMFVAVQAQ
jgi:uncharacterized Zn finger protein (UPF0148 family)